MRTLHTLPSCRLIVRISRSLPPLPARCHLVCYVPSVDVMPVVHLWSSISEFSDAAAVARQFAMGFLVAVLVPPHLVHILHPVHTLCTSYHAVHCLCKSQPHPAIHVNILSTSRPLLSSCGSNVHGALLSFRSRSFTMPSACSHDCTRVWPPCFLGYCERGGWIWFRRSISKQTALAHTQVTMNPSRICHD